MDPKDLLIADLEHFGESLWRNEEVGEKRFNFFVTLVTAVAAGLVALYTSEKGPKISDKTFQSISGVACLGLFAVGLTTYFRMLHRNRVTDEYKKTLGWIRKRYVSFYPDLEAYEVPLRDRVSNPLRKVVKAFLKGGYAETVGVINGMLLAGTIFAFSAHDLDRRFSLWLPVSLIVGIALAVLLVIIACRRALGTTPSHYFRAGAGAVIVNEAGLVLALERAANPGAWQLPQGGLEWCEKPIKAVLREIKEETGLLKDSLHLVGQYPEPLVYELPPEYRKEKTGMGQVQYWFLFSLKGSVEDLPLPKEGEFQSWKWLTFDELLSRAVSFRQPVYKRLLDHFSTMRNLKREKQ